MSNKQSKPCFMSFFIHSVYFIIHSNPKKKVLTDMKIVVGFVNKMMFTVSNDHPSVSHGVKLKRMTAISHMSNLV